MQVETWPCSHLDTQLPNIPLELNSRPGAAYLGIGLGMDQLRLQTLNVVFTGV
jgi:hypothetical protein